MQKHSREELPLTQGQWRRPRVPGCNCTGVAERSYPTTEVRGSGQDKLLHARVKAVAERSYHMAEVRGGS